MSLRCCKEASLFVIIVMDIEKRESIMAKDSVAGLIVGNEEYRQEAIVQMMKLQVE